MCVVHVCIQLKCTSVVQGYVWLWCDNRDTETLARGSSSTNGSGNMPPPSSSPPSSPPRWLFYVRSKACWPSSSPSPSTSPNGYPSSSPKDTGIENIGGYGAYKRPTQRRKTGSSMERGSGLEAAAVARVRVAAAVAAAMGVSLAHRGRIAESARGVQEAAPPLSPLSGLAGLGGCYPRRITVGYSPGGARSSPCVLPCSAAACPGSHTSGRTNFCRWRPCHGPSPHSTSMR